MGNDMAANSTAHDRLEAWVENSGAICVIAVGSHGDPLDLSEHEVEQFIARLQICLRGRTPVTPSLPYAWYETPNLHFLSITDFESFCRERSVAVPRRVFLSKMRTVNALPNLRAETGIYLLTRADTQ